MKSHYQISYWACSNYFVAALILKSYFYFLVIFIDSFATQLIYLHLLHLLINTAKPFRFSFHFKHDYCYDFYHYSQYLLCAALIFINHHSLFNSSEFSWLIFLNFTPHLFYFINLLQQYFKFIFFYREENLLNHVSPPDSKYLKTECDLLH